MNNCLALFENQNHDDFYSGNAEDIKLGALFKEMKRYIDQTVRLNIKTAWRRPPVGRHAFNCWE